MKRIAPGLALALVACLAAPIVVRAIPLELRRDTVAAALPHPGTFLLPAPNQDMPATPARLQTAIFAGGCFWGIQGLFQHVDGVTATLAGYDGGNAATARYAQVSEGTTGHAESVKVIYDPSKVTYGQLLRIFFSAALDPTERDQQYPDHGTQYRSVLFTLNAAQAQVAHAYIAQLDAGRLYAGPIATDVVPDRGFYAAESHHQNFLASFPNNPYIATYDQPKLLALRSLFPSAWHSQPVLALASDTLRS